MSLSVAILALLSTPISALAMGANNTTNAYTPAENHLVNVDDVVKIIDTLKEFRKGDQNVLVKIHSEEEKTQRQMINALKEVAKEAIKNSKQSSNEDEKITTTESNDHSDSTNNDIANSITHEESNDVPLFLILVVVLVVIVAIVAIGRR